MRILYITTVSSTVNAFLIPHIEMLINQGATVDIACQITKEITPRLTELGCEVYNVPFQRNPLSIKNYKAFKEIKEILNNEDYDLIHTHTPVASTISRLAAKSFPDIRVFYTAHGFHFFKGAPLKNWMIFYPIEKFLSKFTDTLITINQEDYEIAKKKFYANEVFYIPGVGIDLKKFNPVNKNEKELLRKKLGYNKKDFILIYVGELSYRKNQKMLIESIRLLNNEINNIKLLLVGTGELKEKYEHLVNKLELENTVKFLGYRTDVKELMQISDLAVSTSRQEGLPVNIMEAMAVGLPLVVTDSRGNRDLVSDQYNGYIVPIDKAQKFSDKVREIYSENEKATKFSENNLKDIKLYSLENILVSMSQFYK